MMEILKEMSSKASQKRLLVVGDLMADKYIWGDQLRMAKEAPVPVMRRVKDIYETGGAARIAQGIKELGADVLLCGIVGFDDAAFSLRQAITRVGIGTGGLFPSELRPTTLKVRIMSQEHQHLLFRLDSESTAALNEDEAASLRGFIEAMLGQVHALVLCDYQKGVFGGTSFARWLIDAAKPRQLPVIVLSRPPGVGAFAGSSLIVATAPAAREFLYLRGRGYPTDLAAVGQEMRSLLHCESLVIVHEDASISNWSQHQRDRFLKSSFMPLQDTTRVEEAIACLSALGVSINLDPSILLTLAADAANLTVKRGGRGFLTLTELEELYEAKG